MIYIYFLFNCLYRIRWAQVHENYIKRKIFKFFFWSIFMEISRHNKLRRDLKFILSKILIWVWLFIFRLKLFNKPSPAHHRRGPRPIVFSSLFLLKKKKKKTLNPIVAKHFVKKKNRFRSEEKNGRSSSEARKGPEIRRIRRSPAQARPRQCDRSTVASLPLSLSLQTLSLSLSKTFIRLRL